MIAAVYVLLISMQTIAAPRVSEAACAWVLWVEEPPKSNHWKIAQRLHAVFGTRKGL